MEKILTANPLNIEKTGKNRNWVSRHKIQKPARTRWKSKNGLGLLGREQRQGFKHRD